MTGTLTLRLHRLTWEAPGVLALDLTDPDGGALPAFTPGAHIDLHLPDGLVRQYSLCGDPAARDVWRIAVRKVGGGRASGFIHRALRPGALLRADGPRNNFPLLGAPRYLFVAGGIGITPILPMIAEAEREGAAWRLFYGGRTRRGMAFLNELEAVSPNVRVVPQDENGLLDLAACLSGLTPDTLVYCCGPEALLAAVESRCATAAPGRLHLERFAARPAAGPAGDTAFEVELRRAGLSVTVPPGMSVLQAAEDAGVPSCPPAGKAPAAPVRRR
jgi:ferredoxin-NADP reductase